MKGDDHHPDTYVYPHNYHPQKYGCISEHIPIAICI